jgi:hypothetical protein
MKHDSDGTKDSAAGLAIEFKATVSRHGVERERLKTIEWNLRHFKI